MPTGYTSFIEDGKISTGKDFLSLCLRNFGVLYFLRDESLSLCDDYTEDIINHYDKDIDYHKRNLAGAEERMQKFKEEDKSKLYDEYIAEQSKNNDRWVNKILKNNEINRKYDKIHQEIEAWDCPEELQNIKKFALNQIEISYEDNGYYEEKLKESVPISDGGFRDFLKSKEESIQWDIDYHKNEMSKKEKSKSSTLAFYQQFKESVKTM